MVKKSKILTLTLFFSFILSSYYILLSSASANGNESNDSEYIDEDSTLPDYGPQVFEEAKKHPGFVAFRGTMPIITDTDEKVEWTDLLVSCSRPLSNSTNKGILPYFVEFDGPVMGFGTSINGYLLVQFEGYSSEKVNESLIDEIYQLINEQCEQKGISEVPVVFEFGGYETESVAVTDEPDQDKIDANISGIEEKTNDNEKSTSQTPGFTSIMTIIGMVLFLIAQRLY